MNDLLQKSELTPEEFSQIGDQPGAAQDELTPEEFAQLGVVKTHRFPLEQIDGHFSEQNLAFLNGVSESDPEAGDKVAAINRSYLKRNFRISDADLANDYEKIRTRFGKILFGEELNDRGFYEKVWEREKNKQYFDSLQFRTADPVEQLRMSASMGYGGVVPMNGMVIPGYKPGQSLLDWSMAPLVNLPAMPEGAPDIPELGLNNPALFAGFWNGFIKPIAEGFTSPAGIATFGASAALAPAARLAGAAGTAARASLAGISGLWTGVMAKTAYEALPHQLEVLQDPNSTFQQKVTTLSEMASEVFFPVVTALHAAYQFKNVQNPQAFGAHRFEGKTPAEAAEMLKRDALRAADNGLAEEARATMEAATAIESLDPEVIKKRAEEIKQLAEEVKKSEEATTKSEADEVGKLGEASSGEVVRSVDNGDGTFSITDAKGNLLDVLTKQDEVAPRMEYWRGQMEQEKLDAQRKALGDIAKKEQERQAALAKEKEDLGAQVLEGTSIRMADLDAMRQKLGLPPATVEEVKTFVDELAKAKERSTGTGVVDRVLKDLQKKMRGTTPEETALLNVEIARLKNERTRLEHEVSNARGKSPEQLSYLLEQVKANVERFDLVSDLAHRSGTHSGQSLAFRRMLLQNDYSLSTMQRRLTVAARGKELPPELVERLKTLSEQISESKKQLDAYKERVINAVNRLKEERVKVRESGTKQQREVSRVQRALYRSRTARTLEQAADEAWARIQQRAASNVNDITQVLSPENLHDIAIVGAALIKRGAVEFADWSREMNLALGEKWKSMQQQLQPYLQELHKYAQEYYVHEAKNRATSYAATDRMAEGFERQKKSGEYKGSPGFTKPEQVDAQTRAMHIAARAGEAGRFWYEESSKAIMELVGGDKRMADKLAQLIGIFSPQTPVPTNWEFAIRAFNAWRSGMDEKVFRNTLRYDESGAPVIDPKTGLQISDTPGMYPRDMGARAAELLYHDKDWEGRKTNNFYNNLMVEIDPSRVQGVTADMWIARAFGYSSDAISSKSPRYDYIQKQLKIVANELGWTGHQVQAAVWVYAKSLWEGMEAEVKAAATEKGIKKQKLENPKYAKLYRKMFNERMEKDLASPSPATPSKEAVTNFAHSMKMKPVFVAFEAIPGLNTGVLGKLIEAPYEVKLEFTKDVLEALQDPVTGKDIIGNVLGWHPNGEIGEPLMSAYVNSAGKLEMNPSVKSSFFSAVGKGGEGGGYLDPVTLQEAQNYARVLARYLHQEAVAGFRPFWDARVRDSNGIFVDMGRPFSEAEVKALLGKIDTNSIAIYPDQRGMYLTRFNESYPIKALHELGEMLLNNSESILHESPREVKLFKSVGLYETRETPLGGRWAGRSDLFERLDVQLAPRLEAVYRRWSERGYGDAPARTRFGPEPAPGLLEKIGQAFKERAEAAQERIVERIQEGQIGANLWADPSFIYDHAVVGAYHIATGLRDAGKWSMKMIEQFGEEIKPHLAAIRVEAERIRREEIRLQSYKTRATNKIADLEQRIANKDFSPPPEPTPMHLDPEARRLQAQVAVLEKKFEAMVKQQEFESATLPEKARIKFLDAYDSARLIMTSGEFSFILRQGKYGIAVNPKQALRAIPDTIRAFMADPAGAHEINLKVLMHPKAEMMKKSGLHLLDEGSTLHQQEEILMGKLAADLSTGAAGEQNLVGKALTKTVGRFNQAATVFLNKLRSDLWLEMTNDGKMSLEDARYVSMFVNEATGRGSLARMEAAAVPLGRMFFAPRYLISRIELMSGHSLFEARNSPVARKAILNAYAKMLVSMGAYYATLSLGFKLLSDDDAEIGTDPRSSDFGKIRIGNSRIDPLAGVSQIAVFLARTLSGETVSATGKEHDLRKGGFGEPKWSEVAVRFGRSKLHPVPGAIIDLFDGTDLAGNETTLLGEVGGMMAPITYRDVWQALEEQNLPVGVAASLLAMLGEGLQTYKPKKSHSPGSRVKSVSNIRRDPVTNRIIGADIEMVHSVGGEQK